jgi:hypothetical protein
MKVNDVGEGSLQNVSAAVVGQWYIDGPGPISAQVVSLARSMMIAAVPA